MFRIIVSLIAAAITLLFAQNRTEEEGTIPETVHKVIEHSCFDCHNSGSRNEDAREAISFDQWDTYKVTRKISKLNDIIDKVSAGEMPPEKYLKFKPDRALSKEDSALVCDWAKQATEELMNTE